jgi:hypothetical protein
MENISDGLLMIACHWHISTASDVYFPFSRQQ